jgi:hypothetical protein
MLLLQSCGWAAKISGSYQAKSVLLALPNTDMFTRSYITKHRLNAAFDTVVLPIPACPQQEHHLY